MNEELMDFVEWLPNNSELFADMDVEAIIAQINDLASSDEGKETLEQLTKQYKSKEMGLFKKGGKLNYLLCLKKGGKVQDCGCGKKIEKAQGGSDGLRERGSVNAYDERYPEFNRDSTWSVVSTPNGPAYVKNVFSGNTLEQNIVTEGINGVPRRTIRSITSYNNPAESDTTYIDANGLEAGRNPGMLARLFGNVHSDKFMDNIDSILVGMEPRQLSEKEVSRTKKKQDGGEISRKDALEMLRTTGSSNKESRREYRDAKREARQSGLREDEMRNAARKAAMTRGIDRIISTFDDVEIEDIPISFEDTFANIEVPTSLGISIMDKVPVTPNDVIGGSFKEAFAEARKRDLKDFVWDNANAKYSRYSTALAKSNKPDELAIHTAPSADDTFVEKYVPANHNPGGMPAAAYDVLYTLGANLRKRK